MNLKSERLLRLMSRPKITMHRRIFYLRYLTLDNKTSATNTIVDCFETMMNYRSDANDKARYSY